MSVVNRFNVNNTPVTLDVGIFDVSANNNGAVFESLSSLLNNINLDTLIPLAVRKGGMTIRFIQGSVPNSDNKYVQYFLTKNEWSSSVNDWQKVNLEEELSQLDKETLGMNAPIDGVIALTDSQFYGLISVSSHLPEDIKSWNKYTPFIQIKKGETVYARVAVGSGYYAISFYSKKSFSSFISGVQAINSQQITQYVFTAESDGFVVVCGCDYYTQDAFTNQHCNLTNSLSQIYTGLNRVFYLNDYLTNETINIPIVECSGLFVLVAKNTTNSSHYWVNFKDANGDTLTYLEIVSDGKYVKNITDSVCYIQIALADIPQSVQFEIYNNGIYRELEGTLKENNFLINGDIKSNYAGNDLILSSNGQLQNISGSKIEKNRYTDFIKVSIGQHIVMRSASDSNHLAIGFYAQKDFNSFVEGVAGQDVYSINTYVYNVKQNGYVVLSSCEYYVDNNFNDSYYYIKLITPTINFYKRRFNPVLPFTKPQFVKKLVEASALPSSDYRSVYPGLGYDIAWDDTNSRYVMVSAGYNGNYAQVGISFSTDLVNWTEYEGNPVFSPTGIEGDPDIGSITFPQLLKNNNEWIMYYIGFSEEGFERGEHKICFATTTDFIHWERGGVCLEVQDFIDSGVWDASKLATGTIYRPRVIRAFGKYYMFINGGPDGDAYPGGANENIYLAESDNPTSEWKVVTMVLDASVVFSSEQYKICSDPDIITDGKNFYMIFWGSGGVYIAASQGTDFPINWTMLDGRIIDNAIRPLVVPTDDGDIYFIVNNGGAVEISLYQSSIFP